MLSVVAMAADLKTGVTYKGTWADIENTVNTADTSLSQRSTLSVALASTASRRASTSYVWLTARL